MKIGHGHPIRRTVDLAFPNHVARGLVESPHDAGRVARLDFIFTVGLVNEEQGLRNKGLVKVVWKYP